MKYFASILVLTFLISSCNQDNDNNAEQADENETEQSAENRRIKDSLTLELDSMHASNGFNGFAVCIANENGTLYESGFGYSDIETKAEYTNNTIQHIASVSKTTIGVALMKAQDMGKLKLDDPIQKYLPFKVFNPFHPDQEITIRHLATHTSGINDTEEQYMAKSWVLYDKQDLTGVNTDYHSQTFNPSESLVPLEVYLKGYLEEAGANYQQNNFIDFEPGERFNYSNVGASLAAFIIEQATGQSFDKFTTEHIFKPLEMNASGWSLDDVAIENHSRLYRSDNSVLPFYTAITYPDGYLITSSSDIAKYITELIRGLQGKGTILSKESYEELFREQLNDGHFEEGSRNASHPYDGDYNPAIFIGHSALGFLGHSGGDAGVSTWMYINKEKSIGMFMVMNTDIGDRKTELEYYAIWSKLEEYCDKLNGLK
jgi:CubicO group peptidase (beta-lactamase class C family)